MKPKISPSLLSKKPWFIVITNREKFDYTKWRKDLFEDMTFEQIA